MRNPRAVTRPMIRMSILLFLAAAGCATGASGQAKEATPLRQRNEGYSLLYKLMSDESDVDKLFIFKNAEEPIASVIKDIAVFSRSTKDRMDEFKKADAQMDYDVGDLPVVEQKVRDLIARLDEKNLLFSTGKEFSAYLVFTQLQAMDYGSKLSKALEDHEDNPDRKKFLEDVSARSGAFAKRLTDLLTVKSS
jgi:hypothetical protein